MKPNAITDAIDKTLKDGYRTGDIADANTDKSKILGTKAMGKRCWSTCK
jgi:3-isopropylmalate dehydrogenase